MTSNSLLILHGTRLRKRACASQTANEVRPSIRHAKAATFTHTAAGPDWARTPPRSNIRNVLTS